MGANRYIVLSTLMLDGVRHLPDPDPDHAIEIPDGAAGELLAGGIIAPAPSVERRPVALIGGPTAVQLAPLIVTNTPPAKTAADVDADATGEGDAPPAGDGQSEGGDNPADASNDAQADTSEAGAGNEAGPAPLPEFDGVDPALVQAIDALDPHNDAFWTKDHRPDATVLAETLGRVVRADERNTAWDAIQAHRAEQAPADESGE